MLLFVEYQQEGSLSASVLAPVLHVSVNLDELRDGASRETTKPVQVNGQELLGRNKPLQIVTFNVESL